MHRGSNCLEQARRIALTGWDKSIFAVFRPGKQAEARSTVLIWADPFDSERLCRLVEGSHETLLDVQRLDREDDLFRGRKNGQDSVITQHKDQRQQSSNIWRPSCHSSSGHSAATMSSYVSRRRISRYDDPSTSTSAPRGREL